MVRVGVRVPRKDGRGCSILPETVLLNVNYSYLQDTHVIQCNFTKNRSTNLQVYTETRQLTRPNGLTWRSPKNCTHPNLHAPKPTCPNSHPCQTLTESQKNMKPCINTDTHTKGFCLYYSSPNSMIMLSSLWSRDWICIMCVFPPFLNLKISFFFHHLPCSDLPWTSTFAPHVIGDAFCLALDLVLYSIKTVDDLRTLRKL